jgi:hypothetical protein
MMQFIKELRNTPQLTVFPPGTPSGAAERFPSIECGEDSVHLTGKHIIPRVFQVVKL